MEQPKSLAQQRLLDSYRSKISTAKLALIIYGILVFVYSFIFYGLSSKLLIITYFFAGLGVAFIVLGSLGKKGSPVYLLIGFILSTLIFIFSLVFFSLVNIFLSGFISLKSYQGWRAAKEWQMEEPDYFEDNALLDGDLAKGKL